MDDEPEKIEEISREEFDEAYTEAIEAAARLHEKLVGMAEQAGYTHHSLRAAYPRYLHIWDKAEADPSLYPFLYSGYMAVKSLTEGINDLYGLTGGIELQTVASTSGSISYSSDAAYSLFVGNEISSETEPILADLPHRTDKEYADQLTSLNPEIAKTYREVWQIVFGTTADRYRAGLFMMRQVYDQFFKHLAPDSAVRASKYWTRKSVKGKDPDQIYRAERFEYASHTHVKDPGVANLLAASSKHLNDLYYLANDAHNRDTLDEEKANKTLTAMNDTLKNWLNALL